MGASTEVDKRELTEALNKFMATADKLTHMRDNTSNSTLTVTGATGWQVTACLMLATVGAMCGAFGLYIAADTRAAQRDTAAHLQTIYMLVPALREQVQEILNKERGK